MNELAERFWAKVVRGDPDECWVWVGALNSDGYGHISVDGRVRSAYKVAYEALVGPVPNGLELDHLCAMRACVNPKHMEPVTHRTNILRGRSAWAVHARKTECVNGHPFDQRDEKGSRRCGECKREGSRRYRIRNGIASAEDVRLHERFDELQAKANAKRSRL